MTNEDKDIKAVKEAVEKGARPDEKPNRPKRSDIFGTTRDVGGSTMITIPKTMVSIMACPPGTRLEIFYKEGKYGKQLIFTNFEQQSRDYDKK